LGGNEKKDLDLQTAEELNESLAEINNVSLQLIEAADIKIS
jgi:hypothetical protein